MLKELTPILINAVIAILTVVIPAIANLIIKFIRMKLDELETKIGEKNYDALVRIAEEIYYVVEQQYLNGVIQDKKAQFDALLLKKFPELNQEALDHIRESIVGKINITVKGR